MLSKSLIQFYVNRRGHISSLLFDLRPNYGGGNEDNGDLLQKVSCTHCCTQCPQPSSRPPLTHASARDSWTLTGKSGSVFCGVTVPWSHWPEKSQFPFQSQRAMAKNVQTNAQLHSSHTLVKKYSKFSSQAPTICEPKLPDS